ncbi:MULTISPECIES: hypothetical protein [Paenibacillus]|uniref:hypothetical protein n=1 Tax=Paenibacillus TaxID=44249 RepID=UPI0011305A59|nr:MULTISPECIES: hypothetical protein [Paenibacillus]
MKKSKGFSYELGKFFPSTIKRNQLDEQLNFEWIHKTINGTVIYIMSDSCTACNFEIVQEFSHNYKEFNHYMLLQSNEEGLKKIVEKYKLHFPIELCEIGAVDESLNYGALAPWVFMVDKFGGIVSAGVYPNYDGLEIQIKPLVSNRIDREN